MLKTLGDIQNVLLSCTLLIAIASPVHAGTVALWREATVVDADVRIGDVCSLDGFEQAVKERFLEV
ncbi:MAG: hypothetical protein GXP29_10885, partial [Planctomycetes bacterium]|nr:hypothetical protein [Planctomycetota bacterium]